MFEAIKKIIPVAVLNKIRPSAHGFLAFLAAVRFGFPSGRLTVIGVTGTAGKSTTIQLLAHILNSSGNKCGYITTVGYFDGYKSHINTHGMSMPSGYVIQSSLAHMLENGCKYAIVEATSEGLAQNRHAGTEFTMALFSNLAPAHIQSHGSFKHYMRAKGKLFKHAKIIGANLDDLNSDYFLSFRAKNKFGVTFMSDDSPAMQVAMRNMVTNVYMGESLQSENLKSTFTLKGGNFEICLPGKFNAYNALLASSAANVLGVSLEQIKIALETFTEISGRMQQVKNSKGFQIFLDYAPEPFAMQNALETISAIPDHKEIIHVFGSTGGHRDIAKRFEFGEISARFADTIIITNDDVYDSDPEEIARNIFEGIDRAKDKRVKNIFTVLDRKEAIARALQIANPGDIILITGKGSEQFLVLPNNQRVEWDEKKIIEDLI